MPDVSDGQHLLATTATGLSEYKNRYMRNAKLRTTAAWCSATFVSDTAFLFVTESRLPPRADSEA
ncbi:MAG: hypothetical protein O3A51_04380, partial [Verrucomicrobia bacterium]|nr:hypothetical protein [Verrucomicrobiota bacterium]